MANSKNDIQHMTVFNYNLHSKCPHCPCGKEAHNMVHCQVLSHIIFCYLEEGQEMEITTTLGTHHSCGVGKIHF